MATRIERPQKSWRDLSCAHKHLGKTLRELVDLLENKATYVDASEVSAYTQMDLFSQHIRQLSLSFQLLNGIKQQAKLLGEIWD